MRNELFKPAKSHNLIDNSVTFHRLKIHNDTTDNMENNIHTRCLDGSVKYVKLNHLDSYHSEHFITNCLSIREINFHF